VLKHNLAGMPGVAVMPQVLDASVTGSSYEEALRLLHRNRPRFRAAHARHQHRLHHRREHQQLRALDACAACSRDYAVL